jgi:tetratricopeptide (TPR) repeat protein
MVKSKMSEEEITKTYVRLVDLAKKEIIIISNNLGELSDPQIMEALRRKMNTTAYLKKHYTKGEKLARKGRYQDAIREFEIAEGVVIPFKFSRHIQEFYGVLFNNLGFCCLKIGDYLKAKRYLERSLEYDPNAVFTNNNLGETCEALGQIENAIKAYQRELTINPRHPSAKQSLERLLSKNNS